ncbi:hypothetical protein BDQ17DRAFT_1329940 [Cyathus striatus]|nr:hypothetical protein BDQ17DRAFT_1329940 [Cyathus striatus]
MGTIGSATLSTPIAFLITPSIQLPQPTSSNPRKRGVLVFLRTFHPRQILLGIFVGFVLSVLFYTVSAVVGYGILLLAKYPLKNENGDSNITLEDAAALGAIGSGAVYFLTWFLESCVHWFYLCRYGDFWAPVVENRAREEMEMRARIVDGIVGN